MPGERGAVEHADIVHSRLPVIAVFPVTLTSTDEHSVVLGPRADVQIPGQTSKPALKTRFTNGLESVAGVWAAPTRISSLPESVWMRELLPVTSASAIAPCSPAVRAWSAARAL